MQTKKLKLFKWFRIFERLDVIENSRRVAKSRPVCMDLKAAGNR
jgi:hypothetical protein